MAKYEKPFIMINEDLAEGVYAASGNWQYYSSNTFGGADVGQGQAGFDITNQHGDFSSDEKEFSVTYTFNTDISDAKVVAGTGQTVVVNGNQVTIYDTANANPNPGEKTDIKIVVTPSDPNVKPEDIQIIP